MFTAPTKVPIPPTFKLEPIFADNSTPRPPSVFNAPVSLSDESVVLVISTLPWKVDIPVTYKALNSPLPNELDHERVPFASD